MSKIPRNFRLDSLTDLRLQKLADLCTKNNDNPFLKKINKTDVLEMLINREYDRLKNEGFIL